MHSISSYALGDPVAFLRGRQEPRLRFELRSQQHSSSIDFWNSTISSLLNIVGIGIILIKPRRIRFHFIEISEHQLSILNQGII